MSSQTFKLVTRSDFDGIVSAVLLRKKGLIERDIQFVHPKDMQDGKVEITGNDITANLPYVASAHLAFDHHLSETMRVEEVPENLIIDANAPSAAQVIYNHFGGAEGFPDISEDMIRAVNKADSAQFNEIEVLDPQGWPLLHFLMDPRTGLGRFHDFRISNYQLMMDLIGYCETLSLKEILEQEDVKERVDVYMKYKEDFTDQLERCGEVRGDVILIDTRNEETIFPGNRFVIYALFPECNLSIHVIWGKQQQNVVFATGKSIFNKTSKVNVGELMLENGGGGHEAAGTCQVDTDKAEEVLEALITKING